MDNRQRLASALVTLNNAIEKLLNNETLKLSSDYRSLLVFYFLRVNESIKSILRLIEGGLFEDALILARTMLEVAITLEYVNNDKDRRTQQLKNTSEEQIRKITDALSGSTTPANRDILPSIINIAIDVLGGSKELSIIYRSLCMNTHTNYDRIKDYLEQDKTTKQIHRKRVNDDDNMILKAIAVVTEVIFHDFLEEFDLKDKGSYSADLVAFHHAVEEAST